LSPEEYYGIAKFYSEARHRALAGFNIVDLRVFGYFSRFADLSEPFLVTDVVRAALAGREFVTGPGDIVRDYVHPADLCDLVLHAIERRGVNDVYDVYSAQPVSKHEILEEFRCRFGLRYRIDESFRPVTATGMKDHYYSNSRKAGVLGYFPQYTALAALVGETAAILDSQAGGSVC
jgi:nucleoside-diphosphate-sugar epimerase